MPVHENANPALNDLQGEPPSVVHSHSDSGPEVGSDSSRWASVLHIGAIDLENHN